MNELDQRIINQKVEINYFENTISKLTSSINEQLSKH